jgi:4-carboxymuconolactone decarboxylase
MHLIINNPLLYDGPWSLLTQEESVMMNRETHTKGLKLLNELHGGHSGMAIIDSMKRICPDFADMTIEWAFGTVMLRPDLDLKTRELALVATCMTLGSAVPQLRAHIEAALNTGATRQEIIEIILQTGFYAGFPATSNAFVVAQAVFEAAPLQA